MHFLRYISGPMLLHYLSLAVRAQDTPNCPDGLSIVEVQPEVIVGLQPIVISTFLTSNTVLTIGGSTIPITNAPTTLVTSFTLTTTSTTQITGYVDHLLL